MVGKTSFSVIKLIGGYSQIHEYAVGAFYTEPCEYLIKLGIIPPDYCCRKSRQSFRCYSHSLGISVYRDESACGQPFCYLAGMTRTARRTVTVDTVGLYIKSLDAFVQQNRDVFEFHYIPTPSRAASSTSSSSFALRSSHLHLSQISQRSVSPITITSFSSPAQSLSG